MPTPKKSATTALSSLTMLGLLITTLPTPAAAAQQIFSDTFTRTSSTSWGSATTGQAYTTNYTTGYSVNGQEGRITVPKGQNKFAQATVTPTDIDATVQIGAPTRPTNATLYSFIRLREQTDGKHYEARVKILGNNTATVNIQYAGATYSSTSLTPDIQFATGVTTSTRINLRTQIFGTDVVTVKAKAWVVGTPEPTTWTSVATDSSATRVSTAGKLGIGFYASSGNSGNVVAAVDNFTASTYANSAPTASFTADTSTDRRVLFNAANSTDSDGTIANYAWNYGDGTTGTGVTSEHTYTTTGAKTVTLTVTDNNGATNISSKTVNVADTHAPSTPGNLAATLNTSGTTLTWNPSDDGSFGTGVAAYKVLRNGIQIGTTTTGIYLDTSAGTGTHSYTISAVDGAGNTSSASTAVTVIRRANPAALSNLALTGLSNTTVALGWTPGVDIDAIRVTRNGAALPASPLPGTTVGFNDTTVAPKTQYTYEFTTTNTSTTSSGSSLVHTSNPTTITATTNPNKPSALTVNATPATTSVALTWTPAADVSTYEVVRDGSVIATLPATTTSYTDAALPSKQTFSYTIRAGNVTGTTTSNTVNPTTLNAAPQAVANVTSSDLLATLTATSSTDSDGTIANYAWDFGDGATGTGATTTHAYATNGTKTAVLTVTDNDGATATSSVTFTVTDAHAPTTVTQAPVTLDSTGAKAQLSWSAANDGNGYGVGGYRIFDNNTLIATVGSGVLAWTSPTLTPGGHSFTVVAIDSSPATNASPASNTQPVTVEDFAGPVTNLTANSTTPTGATITWTPPGVAVSGVKVYGAPTGSPLVALTANLPGNTASYTASGLNANTAYTYRVDTFNSRGTTTGTPVTVTTKRVAPSVPVVSVSGTTPVSTVISWTPSTNTDSYNVYVGVNKVATVGSAVTSYTATGLTPATGYTVRVEAVGDATTTSTSIPVTTKRVAPSAPVLSTGTPTATTIMLTWTSATNTDSYNVYKDGAKIATVGSAVTSYSLTGLTPATGYTFTVEAVGDGATTSNTVNPTTKREAPSAPVLSTSGTTATSATLTWSSSTNTDSYNVYKDGAKIATVGSAVTSYTANALTPATGYTFTVEAVGDGATTSNTVNPTTKRVAPSVPVVSVSGTTPVSTVISWTPSTNTDSYNVYVGVNKVATVGSAVTSYTATGLTPATGYTVRVEAVGDATTTSTSIPVTTKRVAPSAPVLSTSGTTETSTLLSWTPSTNTDTYNVYVGDTQIATVGSAVTSYQVTGLTSTTPFTFTVEAVGDGATISNAATATTLTPNVAPVAAFTPSVSHLTATVNAAASADPDGTITSYAWNFGDGVTATGVNASHTYAAGGTYAVTLTVTDNKGATHTTTTPVAVVDPVYVDDNFNRPPVTNGLGTASTRGGAYLESGSSYSVNGSEALVNTPVGQTKIMRSSGKGLNVDATVAVAFPTRPTTGVIRTGLRVREQAPLGANYIAQVKLYDNGTAYLNWVANTATFTGAAVTTEVPFATDVTSTSKIRIRTQAVGTDPVVLRAKAWIDGTPEPAAWTTEYTDSSATRITTAGNIGVHFYNSGASSSAFVASVDDLRAVAYENSAPVSHATVATNDLLATFDGSTSTDSNGPVTSYMWDFGDGTTATGITVNKKYSTMGSKTATLTVTDNDGATHTSALSFAVADTTAPATPGSVSALLDAPTAVATLTWSPADDGNGYGVSQYTVRDNGTVVATVAGSTTSWTSAALAPGSHMFTVSATDSAPVANASNVSAAATVMVEDFAQPVTNITTSAISSDSATVSWTAPSPAVSGVQVYGGVTGQPLTPLTGVLAGTATSHALTGLAANTNYTLRVDTSNSRGVSAGTPVSFTTKRVAPSAAVLTTGTPTENSVVLSWTPSTNTDSYTIYQAGAPLGTVSGTQTSYTVTGLTATTGYDFYVTAVGDSSTNSNTVTVTTKRPAPSAPVLSASGTTTTATTLTWTASTNADNYTVYRDGQAIATVTDATSYLATGLAPSTLHSFSVVANGDATTSSNTVPVTTLTPNVAPTAAFTSTATDLVATVDASTSTDSDGTIASYAWDFGDGTTGTGANPTHTYAAAGTYTVTLTVTDNNGATHTATGTLTVTAPVTNPAYVDDTFTRNSAATLGSSPVGGAYLDTGSAYAVDGSEARITGSAGATMFARQAVGATDLDLRATIGMPTLPAANVYTGVRIREQASGAAYLARIKMLTDGTASLSLGSIPTTYGTYTSLAGDVTIASGLTSASRINVRTQIVGTSPVTIRAKAWVRGTPEPATWTRTATDSSAARITTAGNAGTYYYAGAAYVGALDDFTVKAYENVAPVADATVTVAGTTATFNASASSDSDGTISNYAWNFGDGTTGTGVTTTHTYAAAGTYTVTLVVTDNNGATHTTTKTVTVTVAQVAPTASFTTAVATTGLVTLDATASSATSGSITGYDWNMGDNNAGTWISGTGAQRVYEYRTAGTYTATLTVTASNGLTHTATRTVVVAAVKPSATNTGVKDPRAIGSIVNGQVVVDPAYALPHVVTGNTYITTDNAVYDGYDFRGLVTIKAKNVTIRNSIIRGRAVSNGGGDAALYITTNLAANPVPDYSGFLIEDTTIVPQTPTNQQNGAHANQPGTFRRVNVYGTVDGLQIWGPGSINILNSYLHDFVHYPTGWNGNNPTHNDTIQVQGGNGHRIVGNNLSGATNAAVMVTEDVANTNDLWINNNWLDNGSCSINFGSNGAVVQTGLVVNNNRFGRNQTNANCAIIRNATWSPVSTTGNVWDDNGAPVSVTNG